MGAGFSVMARRLGFHHSELRRPVDRTQSAVALGLILAFFVLGPLAALRTAQHSYDAGVRAEQHQTTTRHHVDAVVVRERDSVISTSGEFVREPARVRWQSFDGSSHTGHAGTSLPVGAHVSVWADDSGAVTGPPQTRRQTIGSAGIAAAGALFVVAVPLVAAYLVVRRRLDRRRYHEWEAELAQIAGRW